jgi:acetyltransferase
LQALNATLPPNWSPENPIDITDDADAARFRAALSTCLTDNDIDGALTNFPPQAVTTQIVSHRKSWQSRNPRTSC